MTVLATCPYMPNKEAWWRQRKAYYTAWDLPWEEAESALNLSLATSRYRPEIFYPVGLSRQLWAGDKSMCKQSQSQVCSSWSLSQYLFRESFQSCNLRSLSPGRWFILRRVVSVPCHEAVIICLSWNPRWVQREWLRSKTDTKWRRDTMLFSWY
jgi:hypothetical protein